MPRGDGLTFKYGDYQFDPRPLFTTNKEIVKTASNVALATKYSVTIQGTILPTGIDPIEGNVPGLTTVLSGANVLRDAFSQDFKLLLLQCGTDAPIISGYPKVTTVDVSNADDNYIRRADYTINLELPSLTGSTFEPGGVSCNGIGVTGTDLTASGLISVSDDFTVEFLDEKLGGTLGLTGTGVDGTAAFTNLPSIFSVQRTLSAQGDSLGGTGCDTGLPEGALGYVEPWKRAKLYVEANLGPTPEMTGLSGLMGLPYGTNFLNNFRNISVNKTEGSVNATETWIAFTGGVPATEDFEISIDRSLENPLTNISINGTIQGLANIDYSSSIPSGAQNASKFDNALSSWTGNLSQPLGVSGAILSRAQAVYDSLPKHRGNPLGALNINPLSEALGYNIVGGVITYNHSYDDRPMNCYTGALTETISFTFNEPNDVFASLTILGKPQGPLLQQINTSGVPTRDISIDAIVPIGNASTGLCDFGAITNIALDPPVEYEAFVNNYEARLTGLYNQVFVNSHSKSWEPKVGHFTLSKSWTLGYCKGT